MKHVFAATLLTAASFVSSQSTAPIWGQCGGNGWAGPTTCVSGATCTFSNPYYSQCLPGAPSPPTTPSPTPTSSSHPPPPTPTGFVKVSGQKFTLNGADYIVAGTNAYWLAQNTNADIDKAFADIAAAGLTTVRTWGFNEVTAPQNFGAYYHLWTNGTPTVNTGPNGLGKFDYVVSSARAHGLRLIVTLTNNWSDYGGMDVYVSQLNPGGTHDTFYTDQNIIAAYQTYIQAWVTPYQDEPTIMAWELANEPRCAGSTGPAASTCDTTASSTTISTWATAISSHLKSIDPNHLVALGDEGWFQDASPPTYPYAPGVGVNFAANLGIESLDFGTFHSYPESWGQAANKTLWGVDWITSHAAAQKTANKPVLLEEFGVTSNQTLTYQLWWDTVLSSGLTGNLIWQAGSQLSTGPSPNDGYAVYPTSPVYPVMQSAAAALKVRG